MKKGVLYIRVSSKEQAEGFSLEAQLSALQEYAIKHEIEILQEYKDTETAKQAGRKSFREMVKFLKRNNNVQHLLVEKTDRLYRNLKDRVTVSEMDWLNIHLVKEGEVLNKESRSHQNLMHDLKLVIAKNYIENLSEEVKKGQSKKAETGVLPTFAPPGYVNVKKGIELNPPYNAYVRQLFEWFATGDYSLKSLVRKAKESGFTHPQTKQPFTKSSIHRILSTTFYYGMFTWADKTIHGTHQPIISKQLFDEVQRTLNKKNHGSESKRNFPFVGLLKCQACGGSISAELKKGKYVYYRCSFYKGKCGNDYIRQEKLDTLLGGVIKDIKIPDDIAKWMYTMLESELKEMDKHRQSQHQATLKRIEVLKEHLNKAYVDKLDGKITEEFWNEMSQTWQAELVNLTLSMSKNKKPEQLLRSTRDIFELTQTAHIQYINADYSEKRKLLNSVVSNCTYYQENLDITYKKPFDILVKGNKTGDWRRGWDSNPRYLSAHRFSRPAPSTSRTPLQVKRDYFTITEWEITFAIRLCVPLGLFCISLIRKEGWDLPV